MRFAYETKLRFFSSRRDEKCDFRLGLLFSLLSQGKSTLININFARGAVFRPENQREIETSPKILAVRRLTPL